MISLQSITSLTCHTGYISIHFKNEWYQEDISKLTELLFLPIMPVTIQEKITGADREHVRFSWNQHSFILIFDYYSQSCWFEGQDIKSTAMLSALHSALADT